MSRNFKTKIHKNKVTWDLSVSEACQSLKRQAVDTKHQPAFSKDVQDHLLPIYKNLSKDDLLEGCAYTQNFKAVIWCL